MHELLLLSTIKSQKEQPQVFHILYVMLGYYGLLEVGGQLLQVRSCSQCFIRFMKVTIIAEKIMQLSKYLLFIFSAVLAILILCLKHQRKHFIV